MDAARNLRVSKMLFCLETSNSPTMKEILLVIFSSTLYFHFSLMLKEKEISPDRPLVPMWSISTIRLIFIDFLTIL